jgi:hypothetical protein
MHCIAAQPAFRYLASLDQVLLVLNLACLLPLLHTSVSHSLAHSAQQLYTVAIDDAVAQAAAAVTTVAANGADTSSQGGGTFGFLADGFEAFLKVRQCTAANGFGGLQFAAACRGNDQEWWGMGCSWLACGYNQSLHASGVGCACKPTFRQVAK